jgi:hypothetical protein
VTREHADVTDAARRAGVQRPVELAAEADVQKHPGGREHDRRHAGEGSGHAQPEREAAQASERPSLVPATAPAV